MKKHLVALSLITAAITTTSFAHGGQGGHHHHASGKELVTVSIPMDAQQVLRGETVIRLKQKVKQQRPNLDLSKAELTKVSVKAKSKAGQGTVYVKEGRYFSREKTIDMSPKPQGFRKPGGFSWVNLRTPREMGKVGWKMFLNGRIKVKKIDVTFEMPSRQKKSASCSVKLETMFGHSWDTFTAEAKGPNRRAAKAKACKKASRQCQQKLDALATFVPEITNIVSCVKQ